MGGRRGVGEGDGLMGQGGPLPRWTCLCSIISTYDHDYLLSANQTRKLVCEKTRVQTDPSRRFKAGLFHIPVPGKAPALLNTTTPRSRWMYPFMRFCKVTRC